MSGRTAMRGQLVFDFLMDVPPIIPTAPMPTGDDAGNTWLSSMPMLLSRFSYLGIGTDVDQMDIEELHGLYRFLARLAKQADEETQRTGNSDE